MSAKLYANKKEQRRYHYLKDREKHLERSRDYKAKNREKIKAYNRATQLKRHYGMTVADFEALWEKQDGLCAICLGGLERNYRTHVDHDHETGKVRGLLCRGCNSGLGMFHDDLLRVMRAVEYLRGYRRVQDRNVVS